MSHVADFSLQADETPCTILYTIGEQKVDVGKATIMELKKPLFHSRPISPNVFKVSVASVKPGHENLATPVLGGMTTRPRGGLVIVAMGESCCGQRVCFVWRRPGAHPRARSLNKV